MRFVQEVAIFVPKLLKKSLKWGGEVTKFSYKTTKLPTLVCIRNKSGEPECDSNTEYFNKQLTIRYEMTVITHLIIMEIGPRLREN